MSFEFWQRAVTPENRLWWAAGALVGYLIVMLTNPVRRNLIHGLLCIRRYPEIWAILGVLGFGYAVWTLGVQVFYYFSFPEGQKPVFLWGRAFFLPSSDQREILSASLLPSAEWVAGIFNNIVTTYPVSALAALALIGNWDGHNKTLNRALRQRFGIAGWLIHLLVMICALAALAKPALYVLLPMVKEGAALAMLQSALIVDWLSFLFEYLLGVCIQIYLILLAFVWVRGLTFTHSHLVDFAIRRFSVVMRWAAVVMILSSLFIHLPQVLSTFESPSVWLHDHLPARFVDGWVRPLLAVLLILFLTVQITLTFHSESLGEALRHHCRFVVRNGWCVGWFLVIAFTHFYVLTVFSRFLLAGFGSGTAIGVSWQLVYPFVAGVLGAWFLCSWVSLFKACETGRSHFEEMVKV